VNDTVNRPGAAPNPQGKGLVPSLNDLAAFNPARTAPRSPLAFFRDYCVSSLVLAADFNFRPVVDKPYYLYSREENWMLSLIGPREWGERLPGAFVAECRLQPDMTWTVAFAQLKAHSKAAERLQAFVDGFCDTLEAQKDIAAHLPVYVAHLPYYRRVLAAALANSLRDSAPARPALDHVLRRRALPASTDGEG